MKTTKETSYTNHQIAKLLGLAYIDAFYMMRALESKGLVRYVGRAGVSGAPRLFAFDRDLIEGLSDLFAPVTGKAAPKQPQRPKQPSKVNRKSGCACEPWRKEIISWVHDDRGLKWIFQELRAAYGYRGSLSSVNRFLTRLRREGEVERDTRDRLCVRCTEPRFADSRFCERCE